MTNVITIEELTQQLSDTTIVEPLNTSSSEDAEQWAALLHAIDLPMFPLDFLIDVLDAGGVDLVELREALED